MRNSDLWSLEWSQRGNVFHIQPLDDSLSFNRMLYRENTECENDYRTLLIGMKQECEAAAEAARNTLHERESRNGQPA